MKLLYKDDKQVEEYEEKDDYIPESDSEDDYLDEEIEIGERKQRAGVSAEVYGEHNKKGDYKPRVVKKTEE